MIRRVAAFFAVPALILVLASCGDSDADSVSAEKEVQLIGDFQYPENPPEQLRNALKEDIDDRGLLMELSDVEMLEFEGEERSQFTITFTDGSENICVIFFTNNDPSFTMAFKDHDNSQEMIAVLTSVIKYLSPDMSLDEAERLAVNQDETISTDGYSIPQDISGYQVQAQYTNPHIFAAAPDFEAKLGVKVRALKQIWGTFDTQQSQELKTVEDYNLLADEYSNGTGIQQPEYVYADFVVKNVWQRESYLHGETWVIVDAESVTGQQYSLFLDTWEYANAYEFGVDQQYTVYIRLNGRIEIVYAVQQSEAVKFHSRGEVQPIDYPTDDWENPLRRIEPEGEGTVYDIHFVLQSQAYGEWFAALEGHGTGEEQWPRDPEREGYSFAGWYDNIEGSGRPYLKDTPIYQETWLYAKWKYTGSGGIWPRAHQGEIQGIDEESSFTAGQQVIMKAKGYNMNIAEPKDQRFRWIPTSWRLSDGASGSFSEEVPFQATLSFAGKGEQRLYITYLEEIYDGAGWQETGQIRQVEEKTFQVK